MKFEGALIYRDVGGETPTELLAIVGSIPIMLPNGNILTVTTGEPVTIRMLEDGTLEIVPTECS